jgi:hypothetical protein
LPLGDVTTGSITDQPLIILRPAASTQETGSPFLPIGSFSLNYLLDPKSETSPPIGQVRLAKSSRHREKAFNGETLRS